MNELVVADRTTEWRRLKALVLDSVSSPITKRVYNLGLDEFIAWYTQEPRGGFTKATVAAWRVHLESRGLGSISINVRITQCGNSPEKRQITGYLRLNWRPGLRESKVFGHTAFALGIGFRSHRHRCC